MARASVVNDLRRIADRIARLPGQIEQASRRALSTAARQGRTRIARAIRAEAALPARYVSGKLFTKPDGDGYMIGAPRQYGVPVVVYPHRLIPGGPRGKGYRVQFTPRESEDFPWAFAVAKKPTQYGPLLFERTGLKRLPVRVVKDLSVSDWFEAVADDEIPAIEAIARAEMERQAALLRDKLVST